jgi:hypothetical protein
VVSSARLTGRLDTQFAITPSKLFGDRVEVRLLDRVHPAPRGFDTDPRLMRRVGALESVPGRIRPAPVTRNFHDRQALGSLLALTPG